MEVINLSRTDVANVNRKITLGEPGSQAKPSPPTAEELARLTFAKLRDLRIHTQELRNRFARLLNRGSSLE